MVAKEGERASTRAVSFKRRLGVLASGSDTRAI